MPPPTSLPVARRTLPGKKRWTRSRIHRGWLLGCLSLLLLLFLGLPVPVDAATTWTFKVQSDADGIAVTKDSGSPTTLSETVDATQNTSSIQIDTLNIVIYTSQVVSYNTNWMQYTTSYNTTDFRKNDLFVLSTDQTNGPFKAFLENAAPAFIFVGGGADTFYQCDQMLPGFEGTIHCVNATKHSVALFSDITWDETSAYCISLSVTISDDALERDMLTILYYRLFQSRNRVTNMNDIASRNQDRRQSSRGVVGGLYFLVALAMFFLVFLTSVLMAWLVPTSFKMEIYWATAMHFGLESVLIIIITGSAGILGWIICGAIFGICSFTASMFYIYYRTRKSGPNGSQIELEDYSADLSHREPTPKPNYENPDTSKLPGWTSRPERLGKWQKILSITNASLLILTVILAILVFYPAWKVSKHKYYVWDRMNEQEVVEVQVETVAKSTLALYTFDGVAVQFKINYLLVPFTKQCGYIYNRTLTNSEKKVAIGDNYVTMYNIDMNQFYPSDINDYDTVNDFFTRKLAVGVRPVAYPNNDSVITSPADARIAAFVDVATDFQLFVKSCSINVEDLVHFDPYKKNYDSGTMIVVRLAPQDYHRFHAPVTGKIVFQSRVDSTIFSVNADAVQSENKVLLNDRIVSIIETEKFGNVAFIAVGATCVGSIIMEKGSGDSMTKGEEIGKFEFGGSTVVLLFEANTIVVDADVVDATRNNVETFVQCNTQIAVSS